MKIRDQLTLIFSLLTAGVIIGLGVFVYYFSASFHKKEFYDRLEERVFITEQLYLDAHDLDTAVLANIRSKFLQTLDGETEVIRRIYEPAKPVMDSLKMQFPEAFVEQLFRTGKAEYEYKTRQGVGMVFRFPAGNYVVIVSAEDRFGQTKLSNLRRILLIGLPVSLMIVVLIGRFTARRAFSPVAEKVRRVKQITASNLHYRLDVVNEHDEIGELGITFNQMLDRLELAFEQQKKFISNASHEIRNPLAAIIGEADVSLGKDRSNEEYRQSLENISHEAERLNRLVTNLLHLAKTGTDEHSVKKEKIRLDELLLETKKAIDFSNADNRIKLLFEHLPANPDALTIMGNANLLQAALTNVLENACKFSDNKEVNVYLRLYGERELAIEVVDQGIGIPADDMKNIYQPFFRSDNARKFKGFGIGLPLTDRIVTLHQGKIEVYSTEGKGTTVKLIFNLA